MAIIEMNALSTVLCGSFSAKVFFPEMDKLGLGENDYDKKYPVLWLYHSDGGSSMDWLCTPAEKCAAENGIFIIVADVQHCLCTNMEYGPKYEEFMVKELPGICRNNLPLSDKPELNWIGGVGTGAYGAVKAALKHPEVFSACIAMDGIYDMGKICERAKQGETVVCHNEESLKAVFGDIDHIKGSDNDVFALAEKNSSGRYYITGAKGSAYQKEAVELTRILKDRAVYEETDETEADFSCITTMKKAVAWLCGR